MHKVSVKNKLISACLVWVVLCFIMFGFVFPKQQKNSLSIITQLKDLKSQQLVLEAEKNNYLEAKNDLDKLVKAEIAPKDFFSKNITLVSEIKKLENLASELGIKLTLSGISGTLQSATRAKTVSEIFSIPYTINLEGPLDKTISYIEYLENLEFINSIGQMDISAGDKGVVLVNLSANFYIIK